MKLLIWARVDAEEEDGIGQYETAETSEIVGVYTLHLSYF